MSNVPTKSQGFLRLPEILSLVPVSKSTWWAGIKTNRFPKPIKIGPRITAWRAEDITALIEEMGNQVSHGGHRA